MINCSFCGKNENELRSLITGPDVYICNECVSLCAGIIFDEFSKTRNTEFDEMKARRIIFREFWGT